MEKFQFHPRGDFSGARTERRQL